MCHHDPLHDAPTTLPTCNRMCAPRPPCTASALMNVKTALGVTATDWAPASVCTALGSSGGGGFTGLQCDALGNHCYHAHSFLPVWQCTTTLRIGILLSLTFLSSLPLPPSSPPMRMALGGALQLTQVKPLQGAYGRVASRILSLPNLAVLLLDFSWFFGSLPPALVAMPKLTRLGLSYDYLTYRVPPVAAGLKDIDMGFNFLSGSFPANSATLCGANSNCFQAATTCTTKGTAQCITGCNFCKSTNAHGMLCYGRDVCTVNTSVPFAAGMPNAFDIVCGFASPVMCPNDWRCTNLQCIMNFVNCIGYLCV
ncbi:unnamed protein product [Closterium sp. NIES-65]|nr:unnamed protein product [Closterium sp. NIES-65]